MPFKDKIVIITGGGGGLGRGVTRTFLDAGASVIVTYHSEDGRDKLVAALKNPGNLSMYPANLADESAVQDLFGKVKEIHGVPDVLVHLVGGFWMGGDITETPLKQFEAMLDINLKTTFLCCREAFRLMKPRKVGKIFTVSARAAQALPAGMAAYTTSKAAVLAFTQTLASEGAAFGVQANVLLPGIIDTPGNRQAMPQADVDSWVKPGEFGKVLLSLATPDNNSVSGTVVKV